MLSALGAGAPREAMQEYPAKQYASDEARWSGLMASAQSGDELAYRQLLGELSRVVYNYLSHRLGASHFVDDCVQEVLIAVHQARHSYDPTRPFRPWLFAIVRYKAIDAMRRGGREPDSRGLDETLADNTAAGPDAELGSGQMLARLPESLRAAVILTKIVGLSVAETAQQLSISESAVKVRVHRGIGKLRKLMEAEDL